MKKVDVSFKAEIFENLSELPKDDRDLMEVAIKATGNSYAPYSKFHVGAAVLLDNGTIVYGNNQENAAFPSGMCAERIAIWKAASEYPDKKILKLAITANSEEFKVDKPVGPCGACRQTILEYEVKQNSPIEICFMGETGNVVKVDSVISLLPFSFNNFYLPG